MTDTAYVLGVNTKGLEFAEKDADTIERILPSYGYDPVRLKTDKYAVLAELDKMVNNSGMNDRVIFYYSGHGLLESGTLHLLLTEDSERESSKLSITTIYEKLEKCRAAWKLLILDCCHAKAEPQGWAAHRSEKFLVLTASKRLEQAKELKTLQAGFLTYHLCQALEKPTEKMLDQDGILRINEVYDYLLEQTKVYRSKPDSTEIATPDLIGDRSYNFPLGTLPNKAKATAPIPPLDIPAKSWQVGMAESQLLRAEKAQIPFDLVRQSKFQETEDWLDDAKFSQTVRLITGAGGLGKTRLALELCRKRFNNGWQAGFLSKDCTAETIAADWQKLRDANQPLLIVIDYAETRQKVLLALIRAMDKNRPEQPVRVLLLARNGGEWWDNLPGKDADCEPLLSGYATSGPFRLLPLYLAAEDRSTAYQQAVQAFAKTLDKTVPDAVPDLSGEHFGRPLYLQMAALLALYDERPTTAEGLTKGLLDHERRYWGKLLADSNLTNPEDRAQKLLALATLAGGFTSPGQAKPYWMTATENFGTPGELHILFQTLISLYPGKQGLQTVRPDLLGEALVGWTLRRTEADCLLDAVLSHDVDKSVRHHALTVLARLSDQRPDLHETLIDALSRHFAHSYHEILLVAVETGGDLSLLAEAAFNRLPRAAKSQLAGLLEPLLSEGSVQLASLSCAVSDFLVEKAQRKYSKKKNNLRCAFNCSISLINHSVCLRRTGRSDQSLNSAQKACNLLRRLHCKNRKRYAPEYALSLDNVAIYLSYAGEYEEALGYARKALKIRHSLAQNDPIRHAFDHMSSLHNMSNRLGDTGQHTEALQHADHALKICKRLVQKRTDHYESDYAESLQIVSIRLSEAGKYKKALSRAEQALEVYQRMTQKKPDRYEPDYSISLSNYSVRLSEVGKYEDALRQAKQALNILHRLSGKNPERYGEYRISTACEVYFLGWLINPANMEGGSVKLPAIPTTIPSHRYLTLQCYRNFLLACYDSEQAIRRERFKKTITGCEKLSSADQNSTQAYWLCATAWCATFSPEIIANTDWLISWRQFKEQRQGNIPAWMQRTAENLSFEWPE